LVLAVLPNQSLIPQIHQFSELEKLFEKIIKISILKKKFDDQTLIKPSKNNNHYLSQNAGKRRQYPGKTSNIFRKIWP